MKITKKQALRNFHFWSGGNEKASRLTDDEMDRLDDMLTNEGYPDGIDATSLNDLFWFEFEWICELLGLNHDKVLDRPQYCDRSKL